MTAGQIASYGSWKSPIAADLVARGTVVRDRGGFRFFAASEEFQRMEGQYFRSAREAEREALAQSKSRNQPS